MRLPPKVAVIAVAVLAATACSSGSKADPVTTDPVSTAVAPSTTTLPPLTTTVAAPPPTAAPTTTLDPKAEVIAAYEAYFEAFSALTRQPDLSSPAFERFMTGRQRDLVRSRIQERVDGNSATRSPANSVERVTTTVEAISATTAAIVVCFVDDSYRLNLDSGVITNAEITTSLLRVSMVRENGVWKVEYSVTDRTWDGVAGCAV